jgi:hypothetical protein
MANQEAIAALREDIKLLSFDDPWDGLTAQTTKSKKSNLWKNLSQWYEVKCMVTGVIGVKGKQQGQDMVVAAHLWPRSKERSFCRWQTSLDVAVCEDIDQPQNGMFLRKDIEEAYDSQRIIFVCNPFDITIQLKVLDPTLLTQTPTGCGMTYKDLEQVVIGKPTITREKRPSFRVLSLHAMRAVQTAPATWLSHDDKIKLLAIAQVSSPGSSPGKAGH